MTTCIDGLYLCPYNRSHMIAAHKVQSHYMKCRRNYPELAEKIQICEFNQRHHVPVEEMEEHLKECRDRQVYLTGALKPPTEMVFYKDPYIGLQQENRKSDEDEANHAKYLDRQKLFDEVPKCGSKDPAVLAEQCRLNKLDLEEWFCE